MRLLSMLVLLAVLVSGCARTIDGSPRAMGAEDSTLHRILLTASEIDAIVGTSAMSVVDSTTELADSGDEVSDPDCLGALYVAESDVYAGTAWLAVAGQHLADPDEDLAFWVEQSVVRFETTTAAEDFLDRSKIQWTNCVGRSVSTDDEDGEYFWDFEGIAIDETSLAQTARQQDGDGWGCRHVIRRADDVIIEALVCAMDLDGEATQIGEAIAAKLR